MAPKTTDSLHFVLANPLGTTVLTVLGFSGREEISRLYSYSIQAASEKRDIDPAALVGQPVGLSILLPQGSKRYISGYVSKFVQVSEGNNLSNYEMDVVPWLWFLTQRAECRIFQQKTVPAIIKEVFDKAGFSGKYHDDLKGTYSAKEYCVQYRETDFHFVSRLMEEEGIFYFFTHEDGKHTLVLGDNPAAHKPIKPSDSIPYYLTLEETSTREGITYFMAEQSVRPTKVSFRDFNFKQPSVNLEATNELAPDREIYDYPGNYDAKSDGDTYAKIRLEAERTEYKIFNARSTSRRLTTGSTFSMTGHPRAEYNASYLLTAISHQGNNVASSTTYDCSIQCIPAATPFRPDQLTPKPIIAGIQTAIIVGPSGEELWLDEYGRVKVQFHWDRKGKKDDASSCWIRVAQIWAGKNWGGIFNPRIGQEVIVQFEEGDPDRPVITGRLYNAEQMPPYHLPANGTQSGVKSRSSKSGTPDNCNEIRFEDKKGQELFLEHAEKDYHLEVENDEIHTVGHDRTKTVDNNEINTIKKFRTESVGEDEKITITGNRTEEVGKNESISIGDSRTLSVVKDESVNIGKNKTEDIGKNSKFSVGKNAESLIGENLTEQIGKKDTLSVGKEYLIDVGEKFVIQCGDASITLKKDGTIEIKGKDIALKGSGKINVKADGDVTLKGSKIAQN